MEIDRIVKINNIADEILRELYVKALERYRDRLSEELGEYDSQEYASGLMALAVNLSGNLLSGIKKMHESVEIGSLYLCFTEMLVSGLQKVDSMKSLH